MLCRMASYCLRACRRASWRCTDRGAENRRGRDWARRACRINGQRFDGRRRFRKGDNGAPRYGMFTPTQPAEDCSREPTSPAHSWCRQSAVAHNQRRRVVPRRRRVERRRLAVRERVRYAPRSEQPAAIHDAAGRVAAIVRVACWTTTWCARRADRQRRARPCAVDRATESRAARVQASGRAFVRVLVRGRSGAAMDGGTRSGRIRLPPPLAPGSSSKT